MINKSPLADANLVSDLPLPGDAWISFIIRSGQLVPVRDGTVLQAADEVVVLACDADEADLSALFT